ncbi:hypothetical protein E2C01_068513 [Portunus trituberculatus]|uniref:Uncharacterized protein n=1 Tax=Portunus trituberculatus TaxID=210409 RepID=A0A5B7HW29_PORTR|nr:hypothetical protein [Portunus trituberculatus]
MRGVGCHRHGGRSASPNNFDNNFLGKFGSEALSSLLGTYWILQHPAFVRGPAGGWEGEWEGWQGVQGRLGARRGGIRMVRGAAVQLKVQQGQAGPSRARPPPWARLLDKMGELLERICIKQREPSSFPARRRVASGGPGQPCPPRTLLLLLLRRPTPPLHVLTAVSSASPARPLPTSPRVGQLPAGLNVFLIKFRKAAAGMARLSCCPQGPEGPAAPGRHGTARHGWRGTDHPARTMGRN